MIMFNPDMSRVPFLTLLVFPFFFFPSGFSISVVEEDGVQQLYITDVKAGGLAFAKGLCLIEKLSAVAINLLQRRQRAVKNALDVSLHL